MNSSYLNSLNYKDVFETVLYFNRPKSVLEIGILDGFSVQYGEPMHGSGGGVSLAKNATVQNCYINLNIAQSNENSAGGGVFRLQASWSRESLSI